MQTNDLQQPNDDRKIQQSLNDRDFARMVWIAASIFAMVVVLVLLIKNTFDIILLVLGGVIIAVYFRGLSYWIAEKTKLSDTMALLVVVLSTLILLTGAFWFLGSTIQQQITDMKMYIPSSREELESKISRYSWGQELLRNTSGIREKFASNQKIFNVARGFFSSTFGVLGDLYVVIFIGIFFTAGPRLYKNGIVALVPPNGRKKADAVMIRIGHTLRSWLVGQLFAMFVVAVLTTIGLIVLDVPMALTLGIIAGILNFIPNFGPIIAMVPAVLVALSQGTNIALLVAALFTLVQVLESNFLTPMVQKKLIEIPPAYIILGQVVMGTMTGALGIVLATPLIAILMVLIKSLYIEPMEEK